MNNIKHISEFCAGKLTPEEEAEDCMEKLWHDLATDTTVRRDFMNDGEPGETLIMLIARYRNNVIDKDACLKSMMAAVRKKMMEDE